MDNVAGIKVVIIFDSFKGCMDSQSAGNAAALGVLDACPNAHVDVIYMADGGEGTLEAIRYATGCQYITCDAHDALLRPVNTGFLWDADGNTAYVELASSCGLPLLDDSESHVMKTTTYGFGECVKAAIEHGACSIICTLGGSATNDLGLGALQALGLRVFTKDRIISHSICGADLADITDFNTEFLDEIKQKCHISFMYDACIPLTGPYGAVNLYAPQKGASAEDLIKLENGVKHVQDIISKCTGISPSEIKGTGAAGGTGYGLGAFLGAKQLSGADTILDICGFNDRIKNSDYILTGEGRCDKQTMQGKAAEAIRRRAAHYQVPVFLLAGSVADREELIKAGFADVIDINAGKPSEINPMLESVATSRLRMAARSLIEITCGKRK